MKTAPPAIASRPGPSFSNMPPCAKAAPLATTRTAPSTPKCSWNGMPIFASNATPRWRTRWLPAKFLSATSITPRSFATAPAGPLVATPPSTAPTRNRSFSIEAAMSKESSSSSFSFSFSTVRGGGRARGRGTNGSRALICALLFLSSRLFADSTNIDLSRLPPPATNKIDFARDIKPIFDASCIRCHGPVKAKSSFRLISRAAALKGGDNGVDILPGNSAKSPLIHFTAGLVEDMQMPPSGKGEPLTAAQIALLRAWIDQGASWPAATLSNSVAVSLSPTIGGTIVSGDKHKFRELNWREEGLDGGLADFDISQPKGPDTTLSASGHVLNNDYKLKLSL